MTFYQTRMSTIRLLHSISQKAYVYNWLVAAYHPKACPLTIHVPWLLLACQINVTLQHPFHIVPALTAPKVYIGLAEQWFFDIISKTENNTGVMQLLWEVWVGGGRAGFRSKMSINLLQSIDKRSTFSFWVMVLRLEK